MQTVKEITSEPLDYETLIMAHRLMEKLGSKNGLQRSPPRAPTNMPSNQMIHPYMTFQVQPKAPGSDQSVRILQTNAHIRAAQQVQRQQQQHVVLQMQQPPPSSQRPQVIHVQQQQHHSTQATYQLFPQTPSPTQIPQIIYQLAPASSSSHQHHQQQQARVPSFQQPQQIFQISQPSMTPQFQTTNNGGGEKQQWATIRVPIPSSASNSQPQVIGYVVQNSAPQVQQRFTQPATVTSQSRSTPILATSLSLPQQGQTAAIFSCVPLSESQLRNLAKLRDASSSTRLANNLANGQQQQQQQQSVPGSPMKASSLSASATDDEGAGGAMTSQKDKNELAEVEARLEIASQDYFRMKDWSSSGSSASISTDLDPLDLEMESNGSPLDLLNTDDSLDSVFGSDRVNPTVGHDFLSFLSQERIQENGQSGYELFPQQQRQDLQLQPPPGFNTFFSLSNISDENQ